MVNIPVLRVLLIPLMLVAGITLGIIWRRQRQPKVPLDIRKAGVFLAQFVMRLERVMGRNHKIVLVIYLVIFASLITGYSLLHRLGIAGEIVVYCFYGLAMFNLFALFIARWLLDPVPRAVSEDAAVALDSALVQLVAPDTTEKFNQLVDLGEEAFAAWGGSRDDRYVAYTKFSKANPESFKLIKRTGIQNPIGFSCVIPLSESAFRQFRLGIVDTWDLPACDLLSSSDYLCLNAIYLRRTAQDEHTRAVSILCDHIARFVPAGENPPLPFLVADGLTLEGRRFLKRYGFESYYRTRDQTPIFELDLSRPGILHDRARVLFFCLQNALKQRVTVLKTHTPAMKPLTRR